MRYFVYLLLMATTPLVAAQTQPAKAERKVTTKTSQTKTKAKTVKKTEPASEKKPETKSAENTEELTEGPAPEKKKEHGKPALITSQDLAGFDALPDDRKKLIDLALTVARDSPWLPYKFGGSSPEDGGFDCSGAMYFVMQKAGLKPPRTSAEQYLWIQKAERLHEVPPEALELTHPSMAALHPGDLLFWSGTYEATDGRSVNITHVALYLGTEKKDGRHVMINATDGRSYRGKQANGYGVYDFRLPKEGKRSKFAGFGTPPGIAPM